MTMNRNELLVARGRQIVQAAPQLYIDLDVEADGVAGYGSLLSVGAVSPWGEQFYRELRPVRETYSRSARKFCEAHGLSRARLLTEGVEPNEAMRQLADWVAGLQKQYGKSRAVMAAYNASYDFPHIDLAMAEAKVRNPFGIAGFCVKSLALAIYSDYDWSMTAKAKLPAELIPSGDFTHNALEDAIYQQKQHFALAAFLEERRKA